MIGIGTALKQAREGQGFSLKEMQKKTNIQEDYLQALEEERFDHLPSPFYTRGFLRAYAKSLKLDANYLLNLYEKNRKVQAPNKQTTQQLQEPPSQNTSNLPEIKHITHLAPKPTDPYRSKRMSGHRKLTMSQIETFVPRKDLQKMKRRRNRKTATGWVVTTFLVFIFLLVGFIYIGYK